MFCRSHDIPADNERPLNRPLIEKVIAQLEREPHRLGMDSYVEFPYETRQDEQMNKSEIVRLADTCCLAAWIVLLDDRIEQSWSVGQIATKDIDGKRCLIDAAAAKSIGILPEEADALFFRHMWSKECEQVAQLHGEAFVAVFILQQLLKHEQRSADNQKPKKSFWFALVDRAFQITNPLTGKSIYSHKTEA